MAALTANLQVDHLTDQEFREYPVAAAKHIYRGSFVGLHPATKLLKPFEPCDIFVGIAYEEKDNSSGAASALKCRVYTQGDFILTVTSVAVKDENKAIFATTSGDCGFTGHADGFIGRVQHVYDTNKAVVRLKGPGHQIEYSDKGGTILEMIPGAPTGNDGASTAAAAPATACVQSWGGFIASSALGLGLYQAVDHGAIAELDATSEVGTASLQGAPLDLTDGISFEIDLTVNSASTSAVDIEWGLASAITVTDVDPSIHARFHYDGGAETILAGSDDNTVDVAEVTTTVSNVAGTTKKYQLIIRGDSAVPEFYIDGVQVLSTTFATVILLAGNLIPYFNLEKSTGTATAVVTITKLRAAGGGA